MKKLYDTDSFYKTLFSCLLRDFRSLEGPEYNLRIENKLRKSVKDYRDHVWPTRSTAPPMLFKMEAQLENLFKRYRFKDDAYTDIELEERTFSKFRDHQSMLATPRRDLKQSTYIVCQHARLIAKEILGKYDLQEHIDSCTFGSKSNKGVPARKAMLDYKMLHPTGSDEHAMWFYKHIVWDDYPRVPKYVLKEKLEDYHADLRVESLDMINVAKSWKILRGILPDTVLGGFYSLGIHRMVAKRLSAHRLNIRTAQARHKRLACIFSVKNLKKRRNHVTADLSNASNTFTWETMCRLLPREWLKVLDFGRVKQYTYKGETYANRSFMMMGIGYTFTIQTLLFYCLIKAISNLLKVSGVISVYGDDLIYPAKIHKYVVSVLTDLGFELNKDKTYVRDYFRESCGGDYFHGIDVRPFQPEGQHQMLSGKPYVLFLYKTINGLLRAWPHEMLSITIRTILLEILRVDRSILFVPPLFPDYSGIKYELPNHRDIWPFQRPRLHNVGNNAWKWCVNSYKLVPRRTAILDQDCYYWDYKRRKALNLHEPSPLPWENDSVPSIQWSKAVPQPRNYRSKITGKRLSLLIPTVPERMAVPTIDHVNTVFLPQAEGA